MSSAWGAPAIVASPDDAIPPVPTPVSRLFSFTTWTNTNPTKPQPGDRLDADYDHTNAAINLLQQRLALIQRDDGKLANGSVGTDSIDPDVYQDIVDQAAGQAIGDAQDAANVAAAQADAAAQSAARAEAAADAMPVLPGTPGEAVVVSGTGTAYITQPALLDLGAGSFDAVGKRVINLAEPQTATDAATRDYVDNAITASGGIPIPPAANQVLTSTGNVAGQFAWAVPDVTQAELDTAVANTNAALALKADKARTINPGTGLTGGGDLSADRILSLANMPANTVKANVTAGAAAPADVPIDQLVANMSGGLIGIVDITVSGNYTPNPLSNYVLVYVLGGGASADGCNGSGSIAGTGQSGSGGGCAIKRIKKSDLGASVAVTIGAGGAKTAAGTAGAQGGTSSFGSFCSATGGTPTVGGVGVGGDVNLQGDPGFLIPHYGSAGVGPAPGARGAGPIGGPGGQVVKAYTTDGNAAPANSGGGGSSGITTYNTAGAKQSGGPGGSGRIVVLEFK